MLHPLLLLLEAACLTVSWTLLGWQLLPGHLRRRIDPLLRWTSALALGAGATSMLLTAMAATHALGEPQVRALALVELGAAVAIAAFRWREISAELRVSFDLSRIERAALWGLLATCGLSLLATLAPPSAMDATVYHLRVPAEFLRTGTWTKLEQAQSFQPLYVEMLFAEGLAVGGAPLAALVHWVLGVGAIGVAACAARRLGARAIWGAVIFGATALFVWEATSAFIDLGLALFASLSLLWAMSEDAEAAAVVLAGVFGGLAGGSKFTGVVFAALSAATAFVRLWPDRRASLRGAAIIGTVALAIASPWYVRNLILTGNPIYPLANRAFGLPPEPLSAMVYGFGSDPWHLATSPFDLLLRGESFDQGWSIGPLYLAFLPIGFLLRRSRAAMLLMGNLVVWWLIWFYSSPQTRLLLPLLPVAAGIAATGAGAAFTARSRIVRVLALGLLLVAFAGAGATAALSAKSSIRAVMSRETADAYLTRSSWNYPAYERANALLPPDARVASTGLGNNLYYLARRAEWLGKQPRTSQELSARGFTHELEISNCPLPALDSASRAVLATGTYPLPASRLSGGVYSQVCFRLSAVPPPSGIPSR